MDDALPAGGERQPAHDPLPDDARLAIRLLGGFQVSVDGRAIDERAWGRRKAAALVKLLALAPRQRLHREAILEHLWPEGDPDTAGANLRVVLHAARRALQTGQKRDLALLQALDDEIALQLDGEPWVDVDAFERAAEIARQSQDIDDYAAALALYGGELLPGDRYEDWTVSRRERLHDSYLNLLTSYAAVLEERADLPAAIAALERVIAADPTHELAATRLMDAYARAGQRHRALKLYQHLRDALERELDAAPDEEAQRVYGQILARRGPPPAERQESPPSTPPTNIRTPLTRFIGREQQVSETRAALEKARLVTLTGAGGSGKTRLATVVAQSLAGSYPDGAWLVDLSSLGTAEAVPRAVAGTLQLRLDGALDESAAIVAAIGDRELLLVLDNCEHLIDICARLAQALLQDCPRLRVLATSREPLRVAGEVVLRVPTLATPIPGALGLDEIISSEAVQLFCDRARYIRLDFELSADNAEAVATICRRLDGLPLAIELAAARVAMFSLGQLAERLSDPLQILTGGGRTAEPRQQTLRATLDWSFGLLERPEQLLLARLSVFAGGWTLDAAEAICAGDGVERRDVLGLLAGLVDKSLVEAHAGADEARYRLLETVRQYAAERRAEQDPKDTIGQRHADYFLALAEAAERGLLAGEQERWLERLERDLDNLRAALAWSERGGDVARQLRIASAVVRMWWIRGYVIEGRRWLESGLASAAGSAAIEPALRAKALQAAGNLARLQGSAAVAERYLEECLALQRQHGSPRDQAYALNYLAALLRMRDASDRAIELAEESLDLFRQTDDLRGTSLALGTLGELTYAAGDAARSSTYLAEALRYTRQVGDTHSIAITLNNLGEALRAQGLLDEASARFEEGLAIFRELQATHGVAYLLANLGDIARAQGRPQQALDYLLEALKLFDELGYDEALLGVIGSLAALDACYGRPERAAQLFAAEARLRDEIGIALVPTVRADYDQALAAARTRLPEDAFVAAWARGASMTLDELSALAASLDLTPDEPSGAALEGLSQREMDVARLVARGLTNREIAAQLGLAVRTIDTHVGNILRKLRLASRQEIAAHLTRDDARSG